MSSYEETEIKADLQPGVTKIKYKQFSKTDITSVEIPDSVTKIGKHAFSYCYKLRSIKIPNSVTEIGEGAFNSCWELTSITIPNSVTKIVKHMTKF